MRAIRVTINQGVRSCSILSFFKKNNAGSDQGFPQGARPGIAAYLSFETYQRGDSGREQSSKKRRMVRSGVMGPPAGNTNYGCDLVIEFPLIEELNILRDLLDAGLGAKPIQVIPVNSPLAGSRVDIFQIKGLSADYLMVRAANMKLTVDQGKRA